MNRSALLALSALLVFVEAEVFAQSQPSLPDCRSDPTCFSIYMQARQQSDQGNLNEALRLYKAAYEVRADPGIFFSIARVLHKQGQLAEAAADYRRFIDSPLDQPEQKRKARSFLEEISAAQLSPQSSSSQVAHGRASTEKPIYNRWWFWTAIGSGTLAIAAIGLAVGMTQGQPSIPADLNTYEPKF